LELGDVEELHYITHVENIVSICEQGILSHRRAEMVPHNDVSDPEVQDRRKGKRVPGGLLLHDYANTYVTARNPMLFERIRSGYLDELCVVSVEPSILDLEGVVMTDANAASSFCRFRPPSEALPDLDLALVRRTYWTDGSALEQHRCRNAKFSEVLIPQKIDPHHLTGVVHVGSCAATEGLEGYGCPIEIEHNKRLFFDNS
jgi:hypothetical protein